MRIAKPLFVLGACLFLLLAVPFAQAQEIRYFYDDLGRLSGVVDPQGNAARYVYDAVGNILEIRRTNLADFPGAVALTFFDPDRGQVGTVVTIFGAGFSPVPANNQVTFNGTPAVVTASTSQTITTTVPAGATTGPITVTTPLGSATSRENFTVVGNLTVAPTSAEVPAGGTLQFTAKLDGAPTTAVLWTASLGTISATGLYQAPSVVPAPPTATVEALSKDFPGLTATASVTITAEPSGFAFVGGVSVARGTGADRPTFAGGVTIARGTGADQPAFAAGVSVGRGSGADQPTFGTGVSVARGTGADQPTFGLPVSLTTGPVLTSVAPASVAQGATNVSVTLTGTNLAGATNVRLFFTGTLDTSITVNSFTPSADGTQITAMITVAATAPLGTRIVVITTPVASSATQDIGTNTLTVTAP